MEGDSNGNGGDYREEEALLLKALSETKYKSRDIASALNYARRALRVFNSLPGIEPLVSSLRILGHAALSPRPQIQPDYYGILQLEPFSDVESVRRQYKSLALMLHPDKNPSFVCQDAFKVVGEALRVLSDSEEKERYDLGLRARMQEEGLGKEGNVGSGSEGRFWTRCGECGKLHDFEKGYAGNRLVCSGCGKTFRAVGVGDGTDSESEETDEDPGIVAGTSSLKETIGGGDGVVKSGDIIYVRKRKGIANKFGESGAIGKQMSNDEVGNSGGKVVGDKKIKRGGIRASDGYSKGIKGGSDTDEEEEEKEEEGFWDLMLKDGLKKGKKAETSGGWWTKLKVSVKDDKTKNDWGQVRSHVVSGLKVRSRNARKAKSGKKHNTRDLAEEKTVVVMGLRCMTEEDRLKIAKLCDKGHNHVHQSPKADVVSGSGEWGGSRRRSLRVLVKSAEESALILIKKSNAFEEEVMTLAEMQSRLFQKMSGDRRRTSNQKKKIEKEKKREEAEVKLADGGDENEDERVVEQIGADGEEELPNNEKDAVKENESEKDDDEKEPEKMREEEEKASDMDDERKIAETSVKEDDDEQQDQENVNKEDKKEMETALVAPERSEDEKGKGEDQRDMTCDVPIHRDGTTECGTWGNGDEVEETTTGTRCAKRIRCYESKRRALLKRSKDSGVEILETPGPPDHQSGLAIIEKPIVTKSRSVRHTVSSNSDFYNFNKDRGERNFKMGQVWAIYDEFGLPRRYGLIEEVVSINPFAVHLKWLAKQDMKGQDPTAPCSACGRFKVTTSTIVQSVGIFSHEVDGDKVARETCDIYPKKDSVWAIYGGGVRNERYDIVVCLTSYIDVFGLSLAYVEKVEGFRTVYKRKEFGWLAVRWLGKDEVFLLSHQVPARRLSHEDGSDFEEDCWVLDPASIPPSPMVQEDLMEDFDHVALPQKISQLAS